MEFDQAWLSVFPLRGSSVSFPADCSDILGHLSYVGQTWRSGRFPDNRGVSATGQSEASELKVCQPPSLVFLEPRDVDVGVMWMLVLYIYYMQATN